MRHLLALRLFGLLLGRHRRSERVGERIDRLGGVEIGVKPSFEGFPNEAAGSERREGVLLIAAAAAGVADAAAAAC